jgi:hypothetical protein
VTHLRSADGTVLCDHEETHPDARPQPALADDHHHERGSGHEHGHEQGHDHGHGLIDRSILRSRAGIRAVSWSLGVLTVTALAQALIYSRTLSVALLADLIHNFGDALTAIPLGLAFFFRSARGERDSPSCSRSSSAPSSLSSRRLNASSIRARSRTSGCWLSPA